MGDILESGGYRYRIDTAWGKLPEGWSLGEVAGVAVGPTEEVYLFNRSAHPMIVLDRDGSFLRSWGEGVFRNPHGLDIGPDGYLYCTDDGDHSVRKCSPDGRILLVIGTPGQAAPPMSGRPFCRCTHTALSPEGDIYVSDGYANARVHKFSPDGRLLFSWGDRVPILAASTSSTTSAAIATAGSMSPTVKIIVSRCSTVQADTRVSGTTCTGRAASA